MSTLVKKVTTEVTGKYLVGKINDADESSTFVLNRFNLPRKNDSSPSILTLEQVNGIIREFEEVKVILEDAIKNNTPELPQSKPQLPVTGVSPSENALNKDGSFLNGAGISAEHATVVTDEVIELALAPIETRVKVLAPENGIYVNDGTNPTSCLFAVTSVSDFDIKTLVDNYDIELLVECITKDESSSDKTSLKIIDGVWTSTVDNSYRLTDSVENEKTIQNATRVEFMTDAGFINIADDKGTHKFTLSAVRKGSGETITAQVVVKHA